MRVIAVIPAYNEVQTIAEVLKKTRPFVDRLIVVDDGSSDDTAAQAPGQGIILVRHRLNRGLGAALQTGFAAALRLGADVVVTLDADLQHNPSEIVIFLQAIKDGADVVIGSRMIKSAGMPWHRILANTIGNLVTLILFGAYVTDSQSGFRALTANAIRAMDLRTERMEISSELVAEAKRCGLKLQEVPISAIYTSYSLSKGQGFFTGLKTLSKLILRRLR